MKANEKKIIFIELIALIVLILDIFVTNILTDYYLALFVGIILGIIILATGHRKSRQLYEKDIILNILIYCFLYYIIIYISGIFIGFLRSGYNLTFVGIIRNILPVIINILVAEFLRYEVLSKANHNKLLIILTCILSIFIDIKYISYAYDVTAIHGIIKITYTSILPLLSKNILLTYLSYHFGYIPNIIYRLFMEIPTYILPIIPNIDDYISTVIDLLLPAILLYITYHLFHNKKKKEEIRRNRIVNKIVTIIILLMIITIVFLTSGKFKYYALAIGSESMEPNINKGDVVIVEKISTENLSELKVGKVLVYRHNDIVIVHRIVNIVHNDNKYYFNTKGDNNNQEDSWTISESEVIGEAVLRIPYVGIPTVWLNEKV